ncbi:hypothetical protein ABTM35_19225, partial [Acinetobacter baumannii]
MFLRSVAPKSAYADKVTGKQMAPVTSAQIYWGAIPFVGIQLAMVVLMIRMPGLAMGTKSVLPTNVPWIGASQWTGDGGGL